MIALLILVALGALMHAAGSFQTEGAQGSITLGFGFLCLAAAFAGRLFGQLRTPMLTGYIAAGVIGGPFVLGLIDLPTVNGLRIVNGVAVCLIALTAGGELSLRRMKPLLATIRSVTVWAVLGTAVFLTGVIFALTPLLPFLSELSTGAALAVSALLAVALASQSPAVVMALLNETSADGPVSQTTLAVVVIADLVVIVLYALCSSLTTALVGGGADVVATMKTVAWELFGSAGIGLFIGLLLAVFLARVQRGVGLFVLLVCFVVAEVGARSHLDPLIVTLTAGVYLENVSDVDATELIHELEGASLPVYLVFFALAGAALDLDLLATVLIPAAIIAVARGIGFWVGSRYATSRTGADEQVRRWVWVGLLPQAGLALALALLMQRAFPTFGTEAAALVLGVVGLNQVITPILLRVALIRSGEAGQRAAHDFGAPH